MKFYEYFESYGKLPTFRLENEIDNMVSFGKNKPSSRPIYTKKGKKAIAALIKLEKENNHSWYEELKERSEKHPNDLALFYRGNKITFKEMFEKADMVAKSLKESGVNEFDTVPCALSNTPELVYLLLAVNKIGAKINLFGSDFDSDYMSKILDECTNKVLFATDDVYENIKNVTDKKNYKNKVIISLADSLPKDPSKCDEYEPSLKDEYYFENYVATYKKDDAKIKSFNEFLEYGKNYKGETLKKSMLDTEFLETYTSGSTSKGHPKTLVHSNRSLIVSGRFHDSELSGNPDFKGMRGLAHIHPESNTDVITCISDNLMQGWSVALEPVYNKQHALTSIVLNKPTYLNMTTSFLIEASKEYLIDKKFNGRKLPFLFVCFAVGEKVMPGEEKLINEFLRKSKAGSGIKINGFSLPYTTLCVGGGDCEHGGIYYSLWRSLQEKINYPRLKYHKFGLMPEAYVSVTALKPNEDGTYRECDYNEPGYIAANSSTNFKYYKGNKKETEKLILRDDRGRDWLSSNVYGYIDNLGGVHVKGRVEDVITLENKSIPKFEIEEEVCKDTKNILSCTLSNSNVNDEEYYILNIEMQPNKKASTKKIMQSVYSRIEKKFGYGIASNMYFRIIDNKTSFPLKPSGKRNSLALSEMGIEKVRDINGNRLSSNKSVKTYKKI